MVHCPKAHAAPSAAPVPGRAGALFPHAILHESSITFLGFGLSAQQPAIGIVLSESMKHLVTGKWWLALYPGIFLVLTVAMFYVAGEGLRKIADPGSVHG